MNSKLVSSVLAASLVLGAATAFAAAAWTPAAKVTEVYSGYSNGNVYVTGLQNKASCSWGTIVFTKTTSDPDKVQRLALGAMLSGKKLACAVDGCSNGYQVGYQCKVVP